MLFTLKCTTPERSSVRRQRTKQINDFAFYKADQRLRACKWNKCDANEHGCRTHAARNDQPFVRMRHLPPLPMCRHCNNTQHIGTITNKVFGR